MLYVAKGHEYLHELQTMCQAFYPMERFTSVKKEELPFTKGLAIESFIEDEKCGAALYSDGVVIGRYTGEIEGGERASVKNSVYRVLGAYSGQKLAWGKFTGIRPTSLVHAKTGLSDEDIETYLEKEFDMSRDKIALTMETARAERKILARGPGGFGLYVSIPFCPTRCLYCSFVSNDISKYYDKIDDYVACLEKEARFTAGLGFNAPESVYVGGGTPTALDAKTLDRTLGFLGETFDLSKTEELTVEAGRPDTITKEKLKTLKKRGVTRIAINPQTLDDRTLKAIGRGHTAESFIRAFNLAREMGFHNINADIIVGFDGETADTVKRTMSVLAKLSPESVTVHTLAIKRASRLRETLDGENKSPGNFPKPDDMIAVARISAKEMGLSPYYMYRQKNMVGQFENVGYCKEGRECVYNVRMISDGQTIISLGAGAVAKIYEPAENKLERVANVKNADEYIARFDEMIKRKEKFAGRFLG
ncbi:MAG: coproporphyrinogen dehydrogenase HemZ [Clostridiales bacterium]|jgi:oxygen-independent coproporphyrinogen-3 oxidase|nr:coproporphyrinogen dehydrogenase HemZ [Clostridiales bacterium]